MRLTLRTLLAYRDRVLGANELADMHARVQQSAMASNLIQRINALSQRINILAPPIEGKGLGADANSIAEYLDDAIKGEKVPELERICLESDVQLAELAQCHTLLSRALSTTVEVPSSLRQRIVNLSDPQARARALAERSPLQSTDADAKSTESSAADRNTQTPLTPVSLASSNTNSQTTESSTNRSRFRTDPSHHATNSNGKTKEERVLVAAQPVAAPMMTTGGDSIRPSGLDLEGSHLAHEVPEYLRGRSRDGWIGPLAIGALLALLCLLVWQSIGSWSSVKDMLTQKPTNDPAIVSSEPNNPNAAKQNNPNTVDAPAASTPSINASPKPAAPKDSTKPKLPDPNTQSINPKPSIVNDKSIEPKTAANPEAPQSNPIEGTNKPDTEVTATQNAVPQNSVAQWLPAEANAMNSVLLVQTSDMPLHRLQPAEGIPTSTQLFIPAANRPKLDIARSVYWQVCGITHMILMQSETGPNSPSIVDLRLGRALLTPSPSGQAIALSTPAGQLNITLVDPKSQAAIELSYAPKIYGPVTDRQAYPPTLTLYAIDGQVTMQLNNASVTVPAGSMTSVVAGKTSSVQTADAPVWSDPTFERPVDQLAANDLSKELSGDREIGQTLQKLAAHRRPEMRAMAAQTLALLGNWDWVANAKGSLSESRDRTFWGPLIDRSRQILAAHPENAEALTAALTALDPSTAAWRTQLWLGLSEAEFQKDKLSQIVTGLESSQLIDRILSIHQLQRITGKDLGYQAGEVNRNQVQQWQREISSGRLDTLPAPKS